MSECESEWMCLPAWWRGYEVSENAAGILNLFQCDQISQNSAIHIMEQPLYAVSLFSINDYFTVSMEGGYSWVWTKSLMCHQIVRLSHFPIWSCMPHAKLATLNICRVTATINLAGSKEWDSGKL